MTEEKYLGNRFQTQAQSLAALEASEKLRGFGSGHKTGSEPWNPRGKEEVRRRTEGGRTRRVWSWASKGAALR